MALHRLGLAQLNMLIINIINYHYYYSMQFGRIPSGCPIEHCSDHSQSILSFWSRGYWRPVEFSFPPRSLAAFEWSKPMGAYVSGRRIARTCICRRVEFTLWFKVNYAIIPLFLDNFLSSSSKVSPTLTIVPSGVRLMSYGHLLQLLPSSIKGSARHQPVIGVGCYSLLFTKIKKKNQSNKCIWLKQLS